MRILANSQLAIKMIQNSYFLADLFSHETKVWMSNRQDFPPRVDTNQQVTPEVL